MTRDPGVSGAGADRGSMAVDAHQIDCIATEERKLVIQWKDGHRSVFHYVWLRDNCFCDECGRNNTQTRTLRFPALPTDVSPQTVSLDERGDLSILWLGDGHRSVYSLSWLRAHCYSKQERSRRRLKPILWEKTLIDRFPEMTYREALSGARSQLAMLHLLRDYGFLLLRGVPTTPDEVLSVAALLGYPRETYYGQIFDILAVAESDQLSSTTLSILPHTDEGWRSVPMGVILFHCLEAAASGGETILIDGFRVSEALREKNPRAFDQLSRTSWRFHRHNRGEYNLEYEAKIISVDQDSNVVGFRFPFRFRTPLDIAEDEIEPTYAATKSLVSHIFDEDYWLRFALQPGDVLVFDNHRVLHGRTAFSGQRHFRYCYVDRDDFHNRLRLLGGQLGEDDTEMLLPRGALA